MKTIKMTRKEAQTIIENAGWTPYWFETSYGIVNIPGPPAPDYDDYYEEIESRLEDYDIDTEFFYREDVGKERWYDDEEGE